LRRALTAVAIALLAGRTTLVFAGEADVVAATATCVAAECTFEVTVRHADEGWEHYANAYEVVAPDGSVLATRILRHPHVDEQPFRRALSGVKIPPHVTEVRIRARDSVHGLGGREVVVALPANTQQPRPGDR